MNRGPLELEATLQPTEPQPLPYVMVVCPGFVVCLGAVFCLSLASIKVPCPSIDKRKKLMVGGGSNSTFVFSLEKDAFLTSTKGMVQWLACFARLVRLVPTSNRY